MRVERRLDRPQQHDARRVAALQKRIDLADLQVRAAMGVHQVDDIMFHAFD